MNIRTIITMTICIAASLAQATPKVINIAHNDKEQRNMILRVVIRNGEIVHQKYVAKKGNEVKEMTPPLTPQALDNALTLNN